MSTSASSSFRDSFRSYLRRAAIVVGVVTVGLVVYGETSGEEVNWELVIVVAVGMLLSAVGNALWDSRRGRREGK